MRDAGQGDIGVEAAHPGCPAGHQDAGTEAAPGRDPVLDIPLRSVPQSLSGYDAFSLPGYSGPPPPERIGDVWDVTSTESASLAGATAHITTLADHDNVAGAVLFTVDGAQGPVPLGMHALEWGGRGVDEDVQLLVLSPDKTGLFVLVKETTLSRGVSPDNPGADADSSYDGYIVSAKQVRPVDVTMSLAAPVLASKAPYKGKPDQIDSGCQKHKRVTYAVDFEHDKLVRVKTRRCR